MKTRTVITRQCRKNTSVFKLLNELHGDPMHPLYIEAEPGLEQDVLLFRIYQLAAKFGLNLHTRSTPEGVWVRSPYPKFKPTVQIPDEVRIAIVGIEGEKQLCLMVRKTNEAGTALEAVEVSLRHWEEGLTCISQPKSLGSLERKPPLQVLRPAFPTPATPYWLATLPLAVFSGLTVALCSCIALSLTTSRSWQNSIAEGSRIRSH